MTKTILFTRPLSVDDGVLDTLKFSGVGLIHLPTLRVSGFVDENFERSLIHEGINYDGIFFVSQHAVAFALERLNTLKYIWREDIWMAAVGRASACAIEKAWPNIKIVRPNAVQTEDSEGLWQALIQEDLIVTGGKILIVRAQAGRDVLRHRLQSVGLSVDIWSCYQRVAHIWSHAERQQVFEKIQTDGLILFVTSIEGILSLMDNCTEFLDVLLGQPLVTFHPSIATKANLLGFHDVTCVIPDKVTETLLKRSS